MGCNNDMSEALIRAALWEAAGPIYRWSIAAAEEIEALADDPVAIARIIQSATDVKAKEEK